MTRSDLNGMAVLGGLLCVFLVLKASFDVPVHLGLIFVDYPNGRGGLTGAQDSLGDIVFLLMTLVAIAIVTIQLYIWGKSRIEVAENVPHIPDGRGLICCVCIGLGACYILQFLRVPIVIAVLVGAVFGFLIFLWMRVNIDLNRKSIGT